MVDILTILSWLEKAAKNGHTSKAHIRLRVDKIKMLEREGFTVDKTQKLNTFRYWDCTVYWTSPTVPGGKAEELLNICKATSEN